MLFIIDGIVWPLLDNVDSLMDDGLIELGLNMMGRPSDVVCGTGWCCEQRLFEG